MVSIDETISRTEDAEPAIQPTTVRPITRSSPVLGTISPELTRLNADTLLHHCKTVPSKETTGRSNSADRDFNGGTDVAAQLVLGRSLALVEGSLGNPDQQTSSIRQERAQCGMRVR